MEDRDPEHMVYKAPISTPLSPSKLAYPLHFYTTRTLKDISEKMGRKMGKSPPKQFTKYFHPPMALEDYIIVLDEDSDEELEDDCGPDDNVEASSTVVNATGSSGRSPPAAELAYLLGEHREVLKNEKKEKEKKRKRKRVKGRKGTPLNWQLRTTFTNISPKG
jgi:hypothetical protein